MKTQIYNKLYTVSFTLDNEQFLNVGSNLDVYTLSNSRLKSIDTKPIAIFDVLNTRNNDSVGNFLIETDSTGKWSYIGGTTDMVDLTEKIYSLYDASTYTFVGYYKLSASGVVSWVSEANNIANSSEYIATIMTDTPIALINEAVKARAQLSAILGKGTGNIMTLTQTDGTAKVTVSFTVPDNQYTSEIKEFKVATIPSKYQKRLSFPFHSAFEGTQYDVGSTVSVQTDVGSDTQYMLVFFKDEYGSVSFPFIYVINS